jgi:hypothetical protein
VGRVCQAEHAQGAHGCDQAMACNCHEYMRAMGSAYTRVHARCKPQSWPQPFGTAAGCGPAGARMRRKLVVHARQNINLVRTKHLSSHAHTHPHQHLCIRSLTSTPQTSSHHPLTAVLTGLR